MRATGVMEKQVRSHIEGKSIFNECLDCHNKKKDTELMLLACVQVLPLIVFNFTELHFTEVLHLNVTLQLRINTGY